MSRQAASGKWQMMEMPDGITTSNGTWYHITSKDIEKYVPGLQKKVILEKLIQQADAWVLSADALSLLLYFLLAYLSVDPLIAFGVALLSYFFLYFNTSAIVGVQLSRLMLIFSNDGFLYALSAVLLIGISIGGTPLELLSLEIDTSAIWYGIALIFLFKVGLLRLLLKFLSARFSKDSIERHDRILNMLLIRYGMHHGILTKGVNEMQDELIRLRNYHKTRKKK
jgi:hypothetical protein